MTSTISSAEIAAVAQTKSKQRKKVATQAPAVAESNGVVESEAAHVESDATASPQASSADDNSKSAPAAVEEDLTVRVAQISLKLQGLFEVQKEISTSLKTLQKDIAKKQKAHAVALANASKTGGRRRRKADDGASVTPNSFAKPKPISKEMSDFLDMTFPCTVARIDVIRQMYKYIKDNNLQDPTNRKIIKPDDKLKKLLLNASDDTELTFFNIQSYIKHHFLRVDDGDQPVAAIVPAAAS
jgi:upstream activation factor subunit UAF30